MKKILFKIWIYILYNIYIKINKRIKEDSEELYVVYLSHLNPDIYICKGGEYALTLYNELNKVNMLINRPNLKVLYGKVDIVFKYKIPKLMDIVFCFESTDEERKNIYRYVADTPISIR